MIRVAVLVLALLAGCRREAETSAPVGLTLVTRYSASLDATYDGCRGPLAALDATAVLMTGRGDAAEFELTMTPRDVRGLAELKLTPEVARAPVTTRCRWTGTVAVVRQGWRVSLVRADDGEEVACGARATPLELDCEALGVLITRMGEAYVRGDDFVLPDLEAEHTAWATALSCRIVSPLDPALWMLPGSLELGARMVRQRVQAGTQTIEVSSGER